MEDIFSGLSTSGGGAHGAKIRKRIHTHLIFILMGSHTLLGAHIYFHNLLTILAEFLLVLSCVCLTQEMLICCLFLKASESLQVSLCTIQQKPELILILKKMMIFYFWSSTTQYNMSVWPFLSHFPVCSLRYLFLFPTENLLNYITE